MAKLVISGLSERITDEQVAHLRRIMATRLGAVAGLSVAADSLEVEADRGNGLVCRVVCRAEGFPGMDLQVNNLVQGLLADSVAFWLDAVGCAFESVEVHLGACYLVSSNPRLQPRDKHAQIIRVLAMRIAHYAGQESWAQTTSPDDAAVWHELVEALVRQIQELLDQHHELSHTSA